MEARINTLERTVDQLIDANHRVSAQLLAMRYTLVAIIESHPQPERLHNGLLRVYDLLGTDMDTLGIDPDTQRAAREELEHMSRMAEVVVQARKVRPAPT